MELAWYRRIPYVHLGKTAETVTKPGLAGWSAAAEDTGMGRLFERPKFRPPRLRCLIFHNLHDGNDLCI